MLDFFNSQSDFALWIKSITVFAIIFLAGFWFRKHLAEFIRKILAKIGLDLSKDSPSMLKSYMFFWFFLIGLYIASVLSPLNHKDPVFLKIFYAVFSFSIVLLTADIISKAFRKAVAEKIGVNIIKFTIIFVGLVFILNNQFGVKLAPILTALGVGSLAVALALQDTLANFFAGINILASKQIRRGDYISLDSGQQGTIMEVNWRTTRIREISNLVVTIPNSKISSAIITNHHFNGAEVTVSVNCGVSYSSNLEEVEKIAVEAAEDIIAKYDGGVTTFKPLVRFSGFGEQTINFSLIFRVKDIYSRGLIVHEVIKALKKRFEEEKIEIPLPQRVVYLKKDESAN